MPPAKDKCVWSVLVRGEARVAKAAELRALVDGVDGCTIIRDFTIEGSGFLYQMAATTRINPLRSYIGKGAKANVQIKAHPKSTLVAGAATTQAEEGDEYAYTSADDLSDNV